MTQPEKDPLRTTAELVQLGGIHDPAKHDVPTLQAVLDVAGDVSVHSLVGSPDVPAGHLHLNVPTAFSQNAPTPQGEALHSSMSMQAR